MQLFLLSALWFIFHKVFLCSNLIFLHFFLGDSRILIFKLKTRETIFFEIQKIQEINLSTKNVPGSKIVIIAFFLYTEFHIYKGAIVLLTKLVSYTLLNPKTMKTRVWTNDRLFMCLVVSSDFVKTQFLSDLFG